jgi:mono/diheme cytochrome c family protein
MIEQYVDKQELKRLLSSLLVVVGALVIAGLFASIVVPGLRNANKPQTPATVTPAVGESGWLNPTEFPPQKGRAIPPVDPKILMTSSKELMERGKTLFGANCSSCHGQLGKGDGPAAATMNPRPRNFTSPDGWVVGYNMPSIYKVLSDGISGTSMNSFNYLTKRDRMALVHYVQSLGSFDHGSAGSQAIEALSKELAAPGERIPNKIPVSMAMAKLEEEFTEPPPIDILQEDKRAASRLLHRAILNPSRAARVLAGSNLWRESPEALASSILPDAPGNGFSISLAELSAAEWKVLHTELLEQMKRNQRR